MNRREQSGPMPYGHNQYTAIQTSHDIAYANNLPVLNLSGTQNLGRFIFSIMEPGHGSAQRDAAPEYVVDPNLWQYNHAAELMPYYYRNPMSRYGIMGYQKAPINIPAGSRQDNWNSDFALRQGRT